RRRVWPCPLARIWGSSWSTSLECVAVPRALDVCPHPAIQRPRVSPCLPASAARKEGNVRTENLPRIQGLTLLLHSVLIHHSIPEYGHSWVQRWMKFSRQTGSSQQIRAVDVCSRDLGPRSPSLWRAHSQRTQAATEQSKLKMA